MKLEQTSMNETDDKQSSAASTSSPLFIYVITPQQVMTSTDTNNPVTLYIGVYNPPQNGFVPCQYIEFAISIGDTAENQLTNDPTDVQGVANQSSWIIAKQTYSSSPLIFKVTPATGFTGLEAGESIGFELTGININDVAGPAPVRIAEATSSPTPMGQVLINKVPASLQITNFQAAPSWVAPGGTSTLSWATTGASSCTLAPLENSLCSGETPPDPLPTTGQLEVCPLQTTPYTLTAYAEGGGSILRSFSVAVGAVIDSFTATPSTFFRGEPITLTWETSAATSCEIDQGVGVVTPPDSGSVIVSPQEETIYTLTAGGVGTPTQQSVTVTPQTTGWQQAVAPAVQAGFSNLVLLNFQNQLWTIDTENFLVFSSPDGQTWTQITVIEPWPSRGNYGAVVFDGMMWLIGGGMLLQPPLPDDLWVSKDGASWSQYVPSASGFLPRTNFGCAEFQNQLWAFGGVTATLKPAVNDVWSSIDGFAWKQVQPAAQWGASAIFTTTAFNDQLWMCNGAAYGPGASSEAWYTSDGINWLQWNDGTSPPSTVTPWQPGMYPCFQSLNGQLYLVAPQQLWMMNTQMIWSQSSQSVPWTGELLYATAATFNWQLWVAGFNEDDTPQPVLYVYTP